MVVEFDDGRLGLNNSGRAAIASTSEFNGDGNLPMKSITDWIALAFSLSYSERLIDSNSAAFATLISPCASANMIGYQRLAACRTVSVLGVFNWITFFSFSVG